MFNGEVVKVVIYNNVIKNIYNIEGIIEASSSTVIDGMDNLISWMDLLAAPARVPKRLTDLWLGGV